MKSNILFFMTLFLLFIANNIYADEFKIHRGVNISGWLSQATHTGNVRAAYLKQREVDSLARWGFDHIRLPLDEVQMFTDDGSLDTDVFKLVHKAIGWCENANMRVIIDYHTMVDSTSNTLWTKTATQNRFVKQWQTIAEELKDYSNDLVAFELLNEPTAPFASYWNTLAAKVISAIRETQPERKLIVGSNNWENVNDFKYLEVPQGDNNIILTFHFYIPHPLTHYGATWTYMNGITANFIYPGELISDDDFNALTTSQQNSISSYRGYYDKNVLAEFMQLAVNRAKELGGLQLYCGEYGCYHAERTSKINWITDVTADLDSLAIPYSYWEYKQGFGFCNLSREVTDREVLNIITANDTQTTAVKNVMAEHSDKQGRINTLEGICIGTNLDTLPRGLYIYNGKKFVKNH